MKYSMLKLFAIALIFVFVACNDEKKVENTTLETKSTEKKAKPADGVNVSAKGSTSIDISSDGAKVETKSGTNVSVTDKGTKVSTKNVKIDISTRKQ